MYALGQTYSSAYTTLDQDIVVFKIDSSLSYIAPNGWGIVWGSTKYEEAKSIALDDAQSFLYVCGFTNSEGTISSAKFDMFILKLSVTNGLISWGKRLGGDANDKANGIAYYNGFVYVVGESDSTGWSLAGKTDMIYAKLDSSTAVTSYVKALGGAAEDQALIVQGWTDGYIYSLGNGYSVELTYGTLDIFLVRLDQSGNLNYIYNFGGTNPDYAADMHLYGSNVLIMGYS